MSKRFSGFCWLALLEFLLLCSTITVECHETGKHHTGNPQKKERLLDSKCDTAKPSCQVELNICQPLDVPAPKRCELVTTSKQCKDGDQFVEYLPLFYCSPSPDWFMGAILGVWMLVLFYGMSTVAEAFLCPAVKFISERLHLPSDIAGVTVFAFATGAPDIFTQIAAINEGEHVDIQLAVSSTLGSGLFIVCVVLAVVIFIPENGVQLKDPFAFLREAVAYLMSCLLVLAVLWDDSIRMLEAVVLLLGYVIYLTFCLYTMSKRKTGEVQYQHVVRQEVDIELSETAVADVLRRTSFNGQALDDLCGPDVLRRVTVNGGHTEGPRQINGGARSPNSVGGARSPNSALRSQKSIEKDKGVLAAHGTGPTSCKDSMSALYISVEEVLAVQDKPTWMKVLALIFSPVVLFMHATMPSLHAGTYSLRYCMLLSCVAPPFFLAGTGVYPWDCSAAIYIPLVVACALVMYVLQATMFVDNGSGRADRSNVLFAVISFVQSMVWMSLLANEVAALFEGLGNMLGVQEDILGATLLAWGETFPDLVSSVAMAKSGFSAMAVSAAFGGPTLNLLVGTGASVFAAVLVHGEVPAELTNGIVMLVICSALMMIFCMVAPMLHGWKLPRKVGVTLLVLYCACLALFLLSDSHVVSNMQRRVLDIGARG